MTDQDFAALRELRASAAEPSDVAVTRVRHRVTAGLASRERPSTVQRRSRLAVVASAVAVLLVLGLVVAIQVGRGSNQSVGADPSVGASPSVAASASTRASLLPPVTAETPPVRVPAGAVWYTKMTTLASGSTWETWYDPEGLAVLQYAADPPLPGLVTPEQLAAQRKPLQVASLSHPTAAYLDTLPADPAALYDLLLASVDAGPGGKGGLAPEDMIFKQFANVVAPIEAWLSTPVRIAFLEALLRVPGSTLDTARRTFVDRDVYLITVPILGSPNSVVVDRATGRTVGFWSGPSGFTENAVQRLEYGIVAAAGQRP